MTDLTDVNGGSLLQGMTEAKGGAAVLKTELLGLRASYPNGVILVFEGDGDKGVYFQWVKQSRPGFSYEPFLCQGKKNVLMLKKVVDRDRSGLARGVYFLIDRDFDDYQGNDPGASIFMTSRYSIENYLVTHEVLEELLKIDFGCHGKIDLRQAIREQFERALDQFIEVAKGTNFLLYVCRTNNIDLPPVPKKFGRLLEVKLDGAARGDLSEVEYLRPSRIPSEEERQSAEGAFELLAPRLRHRGKFLVSFFKKWLDLLVLERNEGRGIFDGHQFEGAVNTHAFTLENFASKSTLPEGFAEFVGGMVA
jgi:hypothetical protein